MVDVFKQRSFCWKAQNKNVFCKLEAKGYRYLDIDVLQGSQLKPSYSE